MAQLILERIDLLGNDNLRCLSVIKVEGSRSYKAIAFIKSESNPKITRLKTRTYSTLCMSLKKRTVFPKNFIVLFRNTTQSFFNEKLGVMKNGKSKVCHTSRLLGQSNL
jgi:hypothetical protein